MNNFFKYCFLFIPFFSYSQQSKIDSLTSVLKKSKEDTNKINVLNSLAKEICYRNPDTAISLSIQALQLAEKQKWEIGIGKSENQLGISYYLKADYNISLNHYLKALSIWEKLSNASNKNKYLKAAKSKTLGNIGIIYHEQSDYPKALEYYLKALKIDEELKRKSGIAVNLGNIGSVYRNQSDYSKALDYFLKALAVDEELGNKNGIGRELGNIGTVYDRQGDYQKAQDYYSKALKINEELGAKNEIAIWLHWIGDVYSKQSNYPKAQDYYSKALKINEELGNKNGIAYALGKIGDTYTKLKNYKEAEKYLQKALTIATEINALDIVKDQHKNLSELYSQTNKEALALEHYKKYISSRDSINNEENAKKQTRLEMNYEFDKKEAVAIAEHKKELENQQAIAEEKSHKQKIVIWSVICGLMLVVVFAGFIFRSLRVTRKQKQIIEVQKTEVEKSKHIIEEKNKDITDSINYAKRIQQAKLPSKELIYSSLPDSFVLFKPKDIVSGDFYFFHKNKQTVFIASADCTGHGVPGALMSMIGSEQLNDALAHSADTSEILRQLNKGIKNSLHQSDSDESTRDGMDIALCSVDTDARVVKYAGANRPIWIIRNGQTIVEEIKATKKAIGGFTEDSQHFDSHEIKFQQGDTFYIFSDGYADTFSGQGHKKLTTKKFKEILLSIQDKSLKEQEHHLDNFIEDWKSGTEQVDDILVIGVRL